MKRILPTCVAVSIAAALTPIHIIIVSYLWRDYARFVDRSSCRCNCWDTLYKGPYELSSAYKHIYFNATENTLKIWLLIVVFVLVVYECVKYLIRLAVSSQLRYEMLLLFAWSVYPHYYSWWMYLNYYNDDFYDQWYHQLFFTITEALSTYVVLRLANKRRELRLRDVLVVCGVAVLHISAALRDQFYDNVVLRHGQLHQVIRDINFMIPDLLHLVVPLVALRCRGKKLSRTSWRDCRDISLTAVFVVAGSALSSFL